jgi:hypothetical protein
MKDKWTYGDKFFGYTDEFNDNHSTQYPSLLITPPDSVYPEVTPRNGWEEYSFEVYFSDLYNRTQQQNESIEQRWDNLQDLANEWLDMFLKSYMGGTTQPSKGTVISYLTDGSLTIERNKEVANDQLLQIKMNFNWKVFSKCFTPVSTYPTQISNLLVWLRADSGVTFSIPTKKVSAWLDYSGDTTGAGGLPHDIAQSDKTKQPLRYTYGGALDKTMFTFNGTSDILQSNNNCPISDNDFTIFCVAKSEVNTGGALRRIFSYYETPVTTRVNIGYDSSSEIVCEVKDGDGNTASISASGQTDTYHILTAKLESETVSVQYNENAPQTNTVVGLNIPSGYDDVPFCIGGFSPLTADTFFDGNLQEIIIYNGALNSFDTAKVQDYLNKKYRIY